MRIHRQRGQPGGPADREDHTTCTRPNAAAGDHAAGTAGTPGARQAQGTALDQTAPGESAPGDTVAAAMQLAIGLLTAGLDSPELKAWAVTALTPHDADGPGNFMAGLHVVSELMLHELREAT